MLQSESLQLLEKLKNMSELEVFTLPSGVAAFYN